MEAVSVAFGLALMFQAAPPERLAALPAFPGWEETGAERRARYVDIELAARRVSFDESEAPLYRGPKGRALTEITMLAIAHHEGGFAKDVDLGPCYPVKDKATGLVRCDGGRAACLMQLEVGDGDYYGYKKAELFASREACFRAGLRHLRVTIRLCAGKVVPERMFDAYASGKCVASKASAELYASVRAWTKRGPIPLDKDVEPVEMAAAAAAPRQVAAR